MIDEMPERPGQKTVGNPDADPPSRRIGRRWLWRTTVALAVVVLVATLGGLIFVNTAPFGVSPTGDRQARIEQSPRWQDGGFSNARPQWIDGWSANTEAIFGGEDFTSPDPALSVAPTYLDVLATAPSGGLRITWFGHSSMLVEIDGDRLLVDPFWSMQAGPNSLFGADRFFPAPVALSDIGPIDAVLISHDHWDHLDQATMTAMRDWTGTTFVVPLGGWRRSGVVGNPRRADPRTGLVGQHHDRSG